MEEKNYAAVPTSLSHTFGNMTAFITEYVKGLFPTDYFKTVSIASSISYRHFNIFNNTNKEFIKRNKPMLIIRPRVDIMNDDTFLNKTMFTTLMTDNFYVRDFGNLQPFLDDPKKGVMISYLMNRIKMYFDVSIIVESQMEQFNQGVYIKNRVRQDTPFYIETALESNVPKPIMNAIAKDVGMDLTNTKELIDYLNTVSIYPITYKLKNSSGNDEFFRYYPVQVDSMVTGLTLDDGSKKGFVDDSYAINFTIETEFPTSGLYFYFTKEPQTLENFAMVVDEVGVQTPGTVSPSFTVINLFNQEPPPGWVLYTAPLYKIDSANGPDHLNFSSLLNKSLDATIKYQLEKGLSPDMALKVIVFKDNDQLDPIAGDYYIDYNKLELVTNKVNTTSTYRMVIYVNTLYINTLVSDILDFDEEK